MLEVKKGKPGRPRDDRTATLYAWVKPENKKFIVDMAKNSNIKLSPYMDLILDKMREKYGPTK